LTTSELSRIVLDPDELGALYNRCVRCLYLRYRGNVSAVGHPPDDWASSVVGFHSEESWIELRGSKFRFRTYGEQVESQAIAYADCGVSLAFAGRYDALLDLDDQTIALAKCVKKGGDAQPKSHGWALNAYAFALENPRWTNVDKIAVTKLATLEFDAVPVARGRSRIAPKSLVTMERDQKRFANFMRVIARLLAGKTPPSDTCPVCKSLR
jgi:hypothetical protein